MFRILPQTRPRTTEKGMETIMASTTPGMPQICQSDTKISASSPAMAPRVMPKFRPMPAMIGISRLRIRKALRPRRVMISLSRYAGLKPEIGMQTAQMRMNISGTVLLRRKARGFFPAFGVGLLILSPPIFWSARKESCRWRRSRG